MTTTTPRLLRATMRINRLPAAPVTALSGKGAGRLVLSGTLALCLGAGAAFMPSVVKAAPAPDKASAVEGASAAGAQRQPLDHIVAVVNDSAIMRSELDNRIQRIRRKADGGALPARSDMEQQVLDRMVLEEIQLQMADDARMSVDDTRLNRQLRGIAESNGLSLEAFADQLEEDGSSLAQVRRQVRREMLIRKVQQSRIGQRVSISKRDVERTLDQQGSSGNVIVENRARHILIEVNAERSEDEARALAEKTRRRIAQGDDFAAVARELSDDDGSALNGGELGWLRPGQTVPAFEDAMQGLSVDEVSEPVRSQFGFHLIEVEERRRQRVNQEERRKQARQAMFQRRANEEMDTWQREIRSQAFVDIRL